MDEQKMCTSQQPLIYLVAQWLSLPHDVSEFCTIMELQIRLFNNFKLIGHKGKPKGKGSCRPL